MRRTLARALPFTADALGFALAFVYGLPTLFYRVGHDQAMFFYIGREWLHGRIPYRDAFDVKPPGIYALFAAAIAVFGEHQWAPRLLELFAVLAMGALVAHAVRRDGPPRPGERGVGAMLVASFYFSNFDHWDTAQAEFSESFFLVAALVAIERTTSRRAGSFFGGVLVACSVLCKPTAVLAGAVLALVAMERALVDGAGDWKQRARRVVESAVLYGVGGALVAGLCFGYFVAHGALDGLRDFWGYVQQYRHWASREDGWQNSEVFWLIRGGFWTFLSLGSALVATLESVRERAWSRTRGVFWNVALLAAAAGSVAMQGKWFWYHWGVVVPFVALLGMQGLSALARHRAGYPVVIAASLLIGGFFASPRWINNNNFSYYIFVKSFAWEHWRGRITAPQMEDAFAIGPSYHFRINESVALHIRDRARPGDMMHVRSFEPTLYVVAGMRTPTRFPSEYPLEEPGLEYHREAWRAECDRTLWSVRPRFIVTYIDRLADIAVITSHGYREMYREAMFVVMEREP